MVSAVNQSEQAGGRAGKHAGRQAGRLQQTLPMSPRLFDCMLSESYNISNNDSLLLS